MPSLIDLRRRIRAVKSTQQITKAMKMIAASRLRKAHDRIVAARPFAHGMLRVLHSLAGRVDPASHPLLAARDDQAPGARIVLLVVTGDKGLAGSFNSNVIKAAANFIVERAGQQVSLGLVGPEGPRLLPAPRVPGPARAGEPVLAPAISTTRRPWRRP
jgi:F-type H+-transporting ATPase subunit gamma